MRCCVRAGFSQGLPNRITRSTPARSKSSRIRSGMSHRADRTAETWTSGTICYVGRLEPRKGVASGSWRPRSRPPTPARIRFTLVGGDTPYSGGGGVSTREVLQSRIPAALQSRFTFFDFAAAGTARAFLARARMAVVPSRWENFPNTCIEAMSSGLPVLVSPTGGMAEMIEDGRTGWIAAGSIASLEAAFERALARPPHPRRDGSAPRPPIRELCDNEDTVRRQLEFRRRVVARGCRPAAEIASVLEASDQNGTSADALRISISQVSGTRRQRRRSRGPAEPACSGPAKSGCGRVEGAVPG